MNIALEDMLALYNSQDATYASPRELTQWIMDYPFLILYLYSARSKRFISYTVISLIILFFPSFRLLMTVSNQSLTPLK